MTIDEMLERLKNFDDNMKVRVSDGNYFTGNFGSDRADYRDMYLENTTLEKEAKVKTVGDLIRVLNGALKQGRMTGYKGGEYEIEGYTIVTIGWEGFCGNHICDLREKDNIVYVVIYRQVVEEIWK